MIEIKDIAGLSKPLTRLIEVISDGIGAVSRSHLIRRNADADAHRIKTIAAALREVSDDHNLPATYKASDVELAVQPNNRSLILVDEAPAVRAQRRVSFQEERKQANVEAITSVAAEELALEQDVPDERPDEDWINRFFRYAEDVSSEQMRVLWGRILAGEVGRPGSFSLKTLDFVRSLTKQDANLLELFAKVALEAHGRDLVACHDKDWLAEIYSIFPASHFGAAELGVLYPTDLSLRIFSEPSMEREFFFSGSLMLRVERGSIAEQLHLPVWTFTQVGKELLKLTPQEGNRAYLENLGRYFKAQGGQCSVAEVVAKDPNGVISFRNEVPVQDPPLPPGN